MWKKLVLVGGLLACLGLPAFAAADVIDKAPVAKKTIPVELKGKLQRRAVYYLEDDFYHMKPFFPVEAGWEIVADGQTYELDLDNKQDLWVLAEASAGQTVLVKGTWDGDRLHVAGLKADVEHVQKTVKVEVKGRLNVIYPPRDFPPYDLAPMWQVIVGDKTYALDFEGAEGLLPRANELAGRTVILTGELENDTTVRVADLKADDEYLKVTETKAEVKGKLRYVITMWDSGEVVRVCDVLPELLCKCWVINYGFEIDGQVYVLDLHGDKQLEADATKALGLTVAAAGTLKGDRVTVDRLECNDLRFWLEQVPFGPAT